MTLRDIMLLTLFLLCREDITSRRFMAKKAVSKLLGEKRQ